MKLSDGVEWAIHSCTLLAVVPPEGSLPASRLAEFHGVPGAYLAKHLQALARAGIVESVPGRRGGYRLALPAAEVTILDIVLAVEGDERAFRCSEIRQRGPAGLDDPRAYRAPCAIAAAMWRAEAAWRHELAQQTVADILEVLGRAVKPEAVAKTAAWMQEAVR
jgi:Rrf2 family protein